MRKTKQISLKSKKKFAMVVDGQTESWYFQMIKRNHRDLPVDLRPEIPQKKSLKDQYEKVLELVDIYDKVIWIVDLDVIIEETRQTKKGDKTCLATFQEYYDKLEQKENIKVIVNNPCLEFWFLLHFEQTGKFFNDCESASKRLKTFLPGYEKTQKFFTSENNDIYTKLKQNLKDAIVNSGKLPSFSTTNATKGLSDMGNFFRMEEFKDIFK